MSEWKFISKRSEKRCFCSIFKKNIYIYIYHFFFKMGRTGRFSIRSKHYAQTHFQWFSRKIQMGSVILAKTVSKNLEFFEKSWIFRKILKFSEKSWFFKKKSKNLELFHKVAKIMFFKAKSTNSMILERLENRTKFFEHSCGSWKTKKSCVSKNSSKLV